LGSNAKSTRGEATQSNAPRLANVINTGPFGASLIEFLQSGQICHPTLSPAQGIYQVWNWNGVAFLPLFFKDPRPHLVLFDILSLEPFLPLFFGRLLTTSSREKEEREQEKKYLYITQNKTQNTGRKLHRQC
jgi:hypothetical protein